MLGDQHHGDRYQLLSATGSRKRRNAYSGSAIRAESVKQSANSGNTENQRADHRRGRTANKTPRQEWNQDDAKQRREQRRDKLHSDG